MDYLAFHFLASASWQEILLAQLEQLPFNGFEERPSELVAYLSVTEDRPAVREELRLIAEDLGVEWHIEQIADQNWNAEWEKAFQPIQVGNFVGVRAEFHPPFTLVDYELLIHPRMAFGTGHHATTYLMMEKMESLEWSGKSVFDYGCGTGILAILARLLGAGYIDAVDIELQAYQNTLVNLEANDVSGIQVIHGDLSAVPNILYDIILANINRNVILASLPALYDRLGTDAQLLLSGILEKDREQVISRAADLGLRLIDQCERSGWLLIHLAK